MRAWFFLLLLLSGCIGNTDTTDDGDIYTLYLVRHAEKQVDEGKDPALNEIGKYRSAQLATWFQDKDISEIWSSDYIRSRDTASPLALSLGLELILYDPRDLPALTGELQEHRKNALIVGHSNTTPELARLLCQCEIADMDESEYDRLIVVTINGDDTSVSTLMQNTLFQP